MKKLFLYSMIIVLSGCAVQNSAIQMPEEELRQILKRKTLDVRVAHSYLGECTRLDEKNKKIFQQIQLFGAYKQWELIEVGFKKDKKDKNDKNDPYLFSEHIEVIEAIKIRDVNKLDIIPYYKILVGFKTMKDCEKNRYKYINYGSSSDINITVNQ